MTAFLFSLCTDCLADAEAIRRNNCFGFLSYKYKASGHIYSFNMLSGKKDVVEYRGVERNCNPGVSINEFRYALFNNWWAVDHWGSVNAASNAQSVFAISTESSPLIMDVGRKNVVYPMHTTAKRVQPRQVRESDKTNYSSSVRIGESIFDEGSLTIKDIEIEMQNGLGARGLNIAQLLIYIENPEEELSQKSKKIFEYRFEYTDGYFSEFGDINSKNVKISEGEGYLSLSYHESSIKIDLPQNVDPARVSIRVFSDISNNDYENVFEPINVFPNPSVGEIKVSGITGDLDQIDLFNSSNRLVGEKVSYSRLNERTIQLDLSSYQAGIYFLHMTYSGIIEKRRIEVK